MRHPHFPDVGKRIKARMLALGYKNEHGEPDVPAFLDAHPHHRYDVRGFYPWLHHRTPSGQNLDWLVEDLQTTKAYLLLGEGPATAPAKRRKPYPIAGGSDAAPRLAPRDIIWAVVRKSFVFARYRLSLIGLCGRVGAPLAGTLMAA